jgi:hypothetical protein
MITHSFISCYPGEESISFHNMTIQLHLSIEFIVCVMTGKEDNISVGYGRLT